ncbi:hypothetical protein F5051DRAFT_434619, partial [Lentinula edodes]
RVLDTSAKSDDGKWKEDSSDDSSDENGSGSESSGSDSESSGSGSESSGSGSESSGSSSGSSDESGSSSEGSDDDDDIRSRSSIVDDADSCAVKEFSSDIEESQVNSFSTSENKDENGGEKDSGGDEDGGDNEGDKVGRELQAARKRSWNGISKPTSSEAGGNVGRTLKKFIKKVLSKKDFTRKTPFQVIRGVWASVAAHSHSEQGKRMFHPLASNLGFTYIPTSNHSREFALKDFSDNYNEELDKIIDTFDTIVPLSLLTYFRSEFQIEELVDFPSLPASIFCTNAEYLMRFVDKLEEKLFPTLQKSGTLNAKLIDCWFERLNLLQAHIIRGLFPSIGICPRAWQIASLTYSTKGSTIRMLKILEGKVILCNPLAKQKGGDQYESFFLLPKGIA